MEEYVFFDPYREYLRPPLQGLRLHDGVYQPIPLEPDGGLVLQTVGIKLLPEGDRLRMIDVATGERLLWPGEEAAARAEAEARVRALEEELSRLRGERSR